MPIFDENAPLPRSDGGFKTPLLPSSTNTKLKIKPSRSTSQLSTRSSSGLKGSIRGLAAPDEDLNASMTMDKSVLLSNDDGKVKDLEGSVRMLERGYALLRGTVKGWTERIGTLERSLTELQVNIHINTSGNATTPTTSGPIASDDQVDVKLLPPLPDSPLPTTRTQALFDLNPIASPPVPALRARREKEAALRRASLSGVTWSLPADAFVGNWTEELSMQEKKLDNDPGAPGDDIDPSDKSDIQSQQPQLQEAQNMQEILIHTSNMSDVATQTEGPSGPLQTEERMADRAQNAVDIETSLKLVEHGEKLKESSEQIQILLSRVAELERVQAAVSPDHPTLVELYAQEVSLHQQKQEELDTARERITELTKELEETRSFVEMSITAPTSSYSPRTDRRSQVLLLGVVGLLVLLGTQLPGVAGRR